MKKRLMTTCLSVFFLASGLALGSCDFLQSLMQSEPEGGLAYELVGDGYTVVGRGDCEEGIIEIPSKYKGKQVTAIGANAFQNDIEIGLLTIPDSVTVIAESAFDNCINLSEVTMGNSVTVLEDKAFNNCGWLSKITLSDSLVSIGDNAFNGCRNLEEIVFPETLETIGEHAFDYCDGLENVTFGTSLKEIGSYAFYNCKGILEVNIPDGAPTDIKTSAFENCQKIQYVTLGDSVTNVGNAAFKGVSKLRELVIGDSVVSLADEAFYECKKMYKVTVGSSVTSIGTNAFYHCYAIREIYNRSTLNIVADSESEAFGLIGENAYYVRTGKQPSKLSVDEELQLIYYIDGNKKVVVGSMFEDYTDVVLPDDVDEIAPRAFYNIDYVRSIDTGDGCTVIGARAFQNCYHLEKAVIGKSVKTIGLNAFYRNRVLVTVVLKSKLENGSVGENAFWKYKRDANGNVEKSAKEFKTLFFEGSSSDWAETKKAFIITAEKPGNNDLIANSKVTIAYYSETSKSGCWHYVEGVPTLWK